MVSSDLRYVRYDGERLPSLFYGLSRSTDQVLYYEHLQSPFVAIRERSGTAFWSWTPRTLSRQGSWPG